MVAARLLVERTPNGRLEGTITAEDGSVDQRFSSTLELLQALEELTDEAAAPSD